MMVKMSARIRHSIARDSLPLAEECSGKQFYEAAIMKKSNLNTATELFDIVVVCGD